jgi:small subunit ribosomal protein S1
MEQQDPSFDQETPIEQEEQQETQSTAPLDSPPPPEPPQQFSTMESLLEHEDMEIDLPRRGEMRDGTIVSISEDEILVGVGAKSEGVIPGKELDQLGAEVVAEFEVGQPITVYVVTPEDQQGNLLLSYTRAIEEGDWKRAEELLDSGEVYEGTIEGYNKGGLIVNLGLLRGFVPSSQVSLSRRMAFSGKTPDQRWGKMVGEPIATRVIEVDRSRRRLILSERAALQEARELLKERLLEELEVGEVREGRVTSLADFGAFVNINGADGLVHLTEIAWERINHPSEVLKVGQTVNVKVIEIDHERKRIGLSIRQLLSDPWPEKVSGLQVGQLINSKIVRLVKFGAFARVADLGVEGLIHISELSEQRIEHPREVVHEGEELTLRIINIDVDRRRIGLSLRKVDSPAYADLDLEMVLAEEAQDQDEAPEPVAEMEQEAPPASEDLAPVESGAAETEESPAAPAAGEAPQEDQPEAEMELAPVESGAAETEESPEAPAAGEAPEQDQPEAEADLAPQAEVDASEEADQPEESPTAEVQEHPGDLPPEETAGESPAEAEVQEGDTP